MSRTWKQTHITAENIEEYIDHMLTEEDEISFDEHVAECAACAEKVKSARIVSHLFDKWTAKAHGDAYRAYQEREGARVVQALTIVEEGVKDNIALQERLRAWREQWQGKAAAAVRLVMNLPHETSQIVVEGLEALLMPQPLWHFAPVRAARVRGKGAVRTRGATRVKQQVPAEAPEEGQLSVEDNRSGTSVTVEERKIRVRVRGLTRERKAPVVLLVPDAATEKPIAKELVCEASTEDYVAIFEDVSQGTFTLLLEPLKGSE
jgi:hypothetical protein